MKFFNKKSLRSLISKKILIIGLLTLLSLVIIGCNGNNATGNAVADASGVVTIPLSDVSETAQFYTYNAGGVDVNYFVVMGSDGKPRTAFDACDICGGKKGYSQRGTDVVCNNCGKFFKIDDIGSKNSPGGCWPSYLPHKVEGNNVIINVKDIENGRQRFA